MNEIKLIDRCLKKDKKAWDLFVQQYSKLIYWAIRKRSAASSFELSQDDINCIFQQVFLSILEGNKLLQLKDGKAIAGWLTIIAFNKTVDFMRRRIRDNKRLIPDMPILSSSNFEQELFHRDLLNVISNIIDTLPSKEKIVISLNLLKGRTHKEIAGIINIPVNTVSTIIARTKEKLKKELVKQGIKNLIENKHR
ncbi:MAG: sigma-70 family RNA polymerase sigma factor [Omnitrophica bacterium]|nr:sigma-70 family RNA polymerase sigma factor [Candidatus Omnitrophota bacterium]